MSQATGVLPAAADLVVPTPRRVTPLLVSGCVVTLLVLLNVAEHVFHAPAWIGVAAAATLVVLARASGLSWTDLGLGRPHLRSGARWGLGAVAVVGAIYLVAVLVPSTRSGFLDQRYHLPVLGALTSALVVIPVGTVLVEEIAFRSVLWGSLARHARASRVLMTTSVLFALWHVLPAMTVAKANKAVGSAVHGAGAAATLLVVAGTMLVTGVGGVIAGELRRRSGSVLASAGMHWATNGLGVLFGLLAWRLTR